MESGAQGLKSESVVESLPCTRHACTCVAESADQAAPSALPGQVPSRPKFQLGFRVQSFYTALMPQHKYEAADLPSQDHACLPAHLDSLLLELQLALWTPTPCFKTEDPADPGISGTPHPPTSTGCSGSSGRRWEAKRPLKHFRPSCTPTLHSPSKLRHPLKRLAPYALRPILTGHLHRLLLEKKKKAGAGARLSHLGASATLPSQHPLHPNDWVYERGPAHLHRQPLLFRQALGS